MFVLCFHSDARSILAVILLYLAEAESEAESEAGSERQRQSFASASKQQRQNFHLIAFGVLGGGLTGLLTALVITYLLSKDYNNSCISIGLLVLWSSRRSCSYC